jgi:hypothetical protein
MKLAEGLLSERCLSRYWRARALSKRAYLALPLSIRISVRLDLSRRRSLAALLSRSISEGNDAFDIFSSIHRPLAELD